MRKDGKRYLVLSGPCNHRPPWSIVGVEQLRQLYRLPRDLCILVPWDEQHRERVLCGLDREGLVELGVRDDNRYAEIADQLEADRERERRERAEAEARLPPLYPPVDDSDFAAARARIHGMIRRTLSPGRFR